MKCILQFRQKGMIQNESELKRDTANMTKIIFQLKKRKKFFEL